MPDQPLAQQASIHGPYEDAIIAGFHFGEKLIDGQTPDQKQQIWANLIAMSQPFVDIAVRSFKIWFEKSAAPEGKQ